MAGPTRADFVAVLARPAFWLAALFFVCVVVLGFGGLSNLSLPPWAQTAVAVGLLVVGLAAWGGGVFSYFAGLKDATRIIIWYVLVMAAIGGGVILASSLVLKASALLWGLASMAAGGLVGFLFGVPRVLQHDGPAVPATPVPPPSPPPSPPTPGAPPPPPPAVPLLRLSSTAASAPSSATAGPVAYRMSPNTNLEDISDWLTKIIVGLGLVELRNMPGYLRRATNFLAQGLAAPTSSGVVPLNEARTVAAAILIFYSLLGFLGVYLITRLYLAHQFGLADIQNVRLGEDLVSPDEAARQITASIADIQQHLIKLDRTTGPGTAGIASAPEPISPRRVLWVHDNPTSDSLTTGSLLRLGFAVDHATTTVQAVAMLRSQTYGIVASNLGRWEGGLYVERAGFDLIRQVRQIDPAMRIVLFDPQRPDLAAKYRGPATAAGNVVLVSSETDFLAQFS